jgi:hypothetical protein
VPRIYVLSGPDLGHSHDVQDGAVFGRSAECAVPLRDASVSRHHARLERAESGWRVVDTDSRNGVWVGDKRVPCGDLADGDEFRLGEVLLRFRADGAARVLDATRLGTAQVRLAEAPAAAAAEPGAGAGSEPAPAGPHLGFRPLGHATPAAREPTGDVELEGDWTEPVAPRFAPMPADRSDPRQPAIASGPDEPAPMANLRSVATGQRAQKLADAGVRGGTAQADRRGVLQYHRVEQRGAVFQQELAQQPLFLRALVVIAILALTALLGWLGYTAATAVKARVGAPDVAADESAQ